MADNYLITGYWGEPHVTAENDRGIHAGIFGAGRYVLPVGEKFKAEYIGNNTIRMYDGKLMDNGAAAGIPAGEYVDLLISNASQGMNRNDLIVFQYSQDASTLIEKGEFIVVQGIETNGTAADPAITQADLLTGKATLEQFPLWRVSVSGVAISAPVKMFAEAKTIPDKADSGHSHALSSGNITGVLPVTKGGTGANSVSKARKALGLGETEGALPVENGGTGATTAAAARTALGITPYNIGALPITGGVISGSLSAQRDDEQWISLHTARKFDGVLHEANLYTDPGVAALSFLKNGEWSNGLTLHDDYSTLTKPLLVNSGGTGATDAATARANLGIAPENIGALGNSGMQVLDNGFLIIRSDKADGSAASLAVNTEACYYQFFPDGANIKNYLGMHDTFTEFMQPLVVASGGTGANNPAQALQNLGIIYSATEPTYQAGAIWLKPVE